MNKCAHRRDTEHPARIEPSYQPCQTVTKLQATASFEDITAIIERDGEVILAEFTQPETMEKIEQDLKRYKAPDVENGEILVAAGLVSKSDTIANIIDTSGTIDRLLKVILEEKYIAVFETHTEDLISSALLSAAVGLHVGPGTPRQALHRDDMAFPSKHQQGMKIGEAEGFSCFIAGTKVTRENGGTMVIPDSHHWEHDRCGRADEISFLAKI